MAYCRGEEIEVIIDREGLGYDQGIAHLPDDTMVVLFGAGGKVGESVRATVTGIELTPLGPSVLASVNV